MLSDLLDNLDRTFTPYRKLQCKLQPKAKVWPNPENHHDLVADIRNERMGIAPHIEGELRRILQANGFNINDDILYQIVGAIPFSTRKQWQENGWDPESEDEVYDFLKQIAFDLEHLVPPSRPRRRLTMF